MARNCAEGRMMSLSRQQKLLKTAIEQVNCCKGKGEGIGKIYGGLCHKLPVLIRTNGLCQALAFIQSKTSSDGDRGEAHTQLISDVGQLLQNYAGITITNNKVLDAVKELVTPQYALATRVLLQALVFHKRFAESILNVKPGEQDDMAGEDTGGAAS